jgi:HlyD family type I secretion membrane fusion protein
MFSEPNPDLVSPVRSDEFLPPISRWTTLGGLFLVGTCGAALTLAAVTKYNVTVRTAATVRPRGEVRIVQAATEGTVKSIAVKENTVVKQGDAIASIDNSSLQTKKSQLQGNIHQSQQQLAQIAAQISDLDNQRLAESNLMNRTIASARADLSLNQRDYQNKQVTTKADLQQADAALELARAEMKQYQQLAASGAVAQLQIKEKEEAFKAAIAKRESTKASLNPSAAPIAIAQERIAQETAKGESTLATLNKERENLQSKQTEIQNQLGRDVKELQQIGIDLSKTLILAPDAGTILKLNLRNPGQVVRPGETIAQIAPGNAFLVVKARVAAQDISKVRVCQEEQVSDCVQGKVQLRVSAYPYPDYGTLKGAVRAISPDAITPETSGSAAQGSNASAGAGAYYEVTIQPEKDYLVKGNRHYPLKTGMQITADIISREETVLTFILRKARLLTDL